MNSQFEDYDYERAAELRRLRRQKRRRKVMMMRAVFFLVLLLIVAGGAFAVSRIVLKKDSGTSGTSGSGKNDTVSNVTVTEAPRETEAVPAATEAVPAETEAQTATSDLQSTLDQAALLAAGYDYDGAIALLQQLPDYAGNAQVTQAISDYEATKATCTAVDVTTIPHIFYHSLVNNTDAAFNVSVLGQSQVDGMNAWMTTVEEFDKITQQMYDNGYVFVRLHDLVTETTDADGTVHFSPNTSLMLPPGKKAVVLSVDDLSYYHSYEPASFPDKLVLDENGDVKCHYVKPDGSEEIGDFDVVPRLNTFLKEHPDGAYRGARGTIALTGYNGVFGYRTDSDYQTKQHLTEDQQKWLDEHPDFDYDADIAGAKQIAEALKEEGWDFASHTWGHLSVTGKTVDQLRTDNEVYQYFKSAGYNFYCNVDGSQPYWVQITDQYVRQGRIDLDGYMLYRASTGQTTVLDNMFKASEVFDQRRPTPVIANGES